uniref:Uncharacterized protein n=1 Tax=Branchiostoma floridae TaxID=7739 RepID=C3ZTC1_BRAFL|eukprot:XP_002588157.1 hypothetical protein BRAFLDRAFT_68795 [Branchiostoma floridae]
MKLAAELLQAFPRDRYEILIYCKPYIVALKTGTLEFDETGDFVGEAMEIVDAGNYKGALLLLAEQTFLPRYLAEKLQQKGDICTLRHTDGFVRDVREEVDKLLKDEDDENDEEEHDEPERTTPRGNAYLLVVSPGEQVLMTGDEDRHGRDKEDPRTPAPLTETRKPGARPKVNRKLYPDLPTQDGSQDSWSTGSTKGKRETGPGDGIRDVRSNAGKESSDKDQNPSISPQIYVSPSSRHPKKDPSPDERSDETSASKASSGVSSGVHMWYKEKIAAGLDGSKLNSTPDILYEENKQIYDMSWSTSDFEHPTPMETESVPDYPTPMETESTPFQRDNLADSTASSPNDSIDDGHVRLFTSNFRGIHPENLPLFCLFECIEAPINRLRDQDIVPFTTGLTIQKWCFEPVKEEQVLSRNVDTAAIQLLFLQAQADVREEYCDPSFPLHGRYVQLCQTLEDYSSVRFRDVIVERDVCLDNLKVPVGTIVELNVTLSGLRLVIGTATLSIVWSRITSWTNVKEGIHIQYEVYSPDTGSRDILALQTIQAPYLLATTMEIIAALQKEQCGPAFHTSQVHREEEGTITHWDNVLFQK